MLHCERCYNLFFFELGRKHNTKCKVHLSTKFSMFLYRSESGAFAEQQAAMYGNADFASARLALDWLCGAHNLRFFSTLR